jgi:putative aldouronate transport system substrate-binding protein
MVMSTRKKRNLAVCVACLTILAPVLFGQGNREQKSDSGTNTVPTAAPAFTAGAPAAAAQSSARKVIKVELFDRGNAKPGEAGPSDNMWTQYIKSEFSAKTNIDIEWVLVPRSKEVEQLNLLMAAGNAPDLVFTYDANLVYQFVKYGGLTDLGPSIEKNGPTLKSFLGSDVLKWGLYGGKQYAIPGRRTVYSPMTTWIRKDWLNAVKLDAPKTTQEMYAALRAFKESNVDGLGTAMVPFRFARYGWQQVSETFTTKMTEEERYLYHDFALERVMFMKPGYREGLRFFNKLMNEGLANLDYLLDKDNKKANENMVNGRIGSIVQNFDLGYNLLDELAKNAPAAEFIPVDPWTNFEGKRPKYSPNTYGVFNMVPKTSKAADEVVQYLNWLSDDKVIFFMQNGIEGKQHNLVDGFPYAITLTEEMRKAPWSSNNGDILLTVNGKWLGSVDKSVKAQSLGYPKYARLFMDTFNSARNDWLPAVRFERPIDAEAKYGVALNAKMEELLAKMMLAKPAEFDKVYDACVDEYLKAGAESILAERRIAYGEMKK